jgi:hypothetical protein
MISGRNEDALKLLDVTKKLIDLRYFPRMSAVRARRQQALSLVKENQLPLVVCVSK